MSSTVAVLGHVPAELAGWVDGARSSLAWMGELDEALSGADWVIDAGMERQSEKCARLRRLETMGVRSVLSASNTVTRAAQVAALSGTLHVVGIDPLLMMCGAKTQTVVGATASDLLWLTAIWPERRFVPVADAVGLIFSREILPVINEAVDFLHRDLLPEDIDRAVQLGLNYPRGPFVWAELFGWEAVYYGLKALEDTYGPRFRPHPWIRSRVARGWDGGTTDNDWYIPGGKGRHNDA